MYSGAMGNWICLWLPSSNSPASMLNNMKKADWLPLVRAILCRVTGQPNFLLNNWAKASINSILPWAGSYRPRSCLTAIGSLANFCRRCCIIASICGMLAGLPPPIIIISRPLERALVMSSINTLIPVLPLNFWPKVDNFTVHFRVKWVLNQAMDHIAWWLISSQQIVFAAHSRGHTTDIFAKTLLYLHRQSVHRP